MKKGKYMDYNILLACYSHRQDEVIQKSAYSLNSISNLKLSKESSGVGTIEKDTNLLTYTQTAFALMD